jgi:hypothetical protein
MNVPHGLGTDTPSSWPVRPQTGSQVVPLSRARSEDEMAVLLVAVIGIGVFVVLVVRGASVGARVR